VRSKDGIEERKKWEGKKWQVRVEEYGTKLGVLGHTI